MKVALLQLNYMIGDIDGNAGKIISAVKSVKDQNVDLCITTELSLLGYPPRDLLLNNTFIRKSWEKLNQIAKELINYPAVLIGIADYNKKKTGKSLYNTAVLICNGKIENKFNKTLLPTYDVFDEERYFEPAESVQILTLNDYNFGITICEDIWNDKNLLTEQLVEQPTEQQYNNNPIPALISQGIDCLINIAASPFTIWKHDIRYSILKNIADKYKKPVLYVNQVGGNDDLVFDGGSCVFNNEASIIAQGDFFKEDIVIVDLENLSESNNEIDTSVNNMAWNALVLGTRDYIKKCGFSKALLGLSGGIDSSLTAAIAAEAIGAENVTGVLMPSPYSSKGSITDSLKLAKNIGIKTIELPIKNIMDAYDNTLADTFKGYKPDITEENIQARIRGNLLMALSNKYSSILLTTGNKSELAVGYCTIYGDMSGGLAVISDVPKTMVYNLARWINSKKGSIIPEEILIKAPSAELRHGQRDQDSLPDYEILDKIIYLYIEQHKSAEEIIEEGFNEDIVKKVLNLISRAEFKRRQAPPGIKITDRAFGTGWRVPIASKKLF